MAPVLEFLTASAALLTQYAVPKGLPKGVVNNVRTNLLASANASWELGTATQALIELDWPAVSVYNETAFPPPSHVDGAPEAEEVLGIANKVLLSKPADSSALVADDGAAGDPPSLGVAMLLANYTLNNRDNKTFEDAAASQLNYLLHDVPRTEEGAISHRAEEVQLWADSVYMVPPFLAYYGALQSGNDKKDLIKEAVNQIRLYRTALRDDSGLWRHVVLGSWEDKVHWTTGNAWAAAGMFRVLETIVNSDSEADFRDETRDLTEWISEITTTAWNFQTENGTLRNVIDDEDSFADTAGTALLAAVTYRMATYTDDTNLIPKANKAFNLVRDSINEQGWVQNTVDPYTFSTRTEDGKHSPEAQAFALMIEAARRDFVNYVQDNSTDSSDPSLQRRQVCKLRK